METFDMSFRNGEKQNKINTNLFRGIIAIAFSIILLLSCFSVASATEKTGFPHALSGTINTLKVYDSYGYICTNSNLFIMNISSPNNPTTVKKYDMAWTKDLAISGNYAYVANWVYGLAVINLTDPYNPVKVEQYDIDIDACGITIFGNCAYVINGGKELAIIDLSNPSTPELIKKYKFNSNINEIFTDDHYMYASSEDGLFILDIANPTNPQKVGEYKIKMYDRCATVFGRYAYIASRNDGLIILDISNPSNPTKVEQYGHYRNYKDFCDRPFDVSVNGNYVYVAKRYNKADRTGFDILDIMDPSNPKKLGEYKQNCVGAIKKVIPSGNYAYALDDVYGLCIMDITDIHNPKVVGRFQ